MTLRSRHVVATSTIIFFALQLCGAVLLTSGGIGPYFSGGNILPFTLLSIVGPIIMLRLDQSTSAIASRRRFWWMTSLCVAIVLGMMTRQLIMRHTNVVAGIHDGAVQAEVAADKLIHGVNPYGADYRGTNYELLNPPIEGGPAINVVWSHVIYPPFVFEAFLPLAALRGVIGVLADYRWLTVGALGLLTWLLVRQVVDWEERAKIVALTLGNPLLWMYAIIGTNDGLAAGLVIVSMLLQRRQRWWWAGAVFALAMATKQSVWILFPLWLVWCWHETCDRLSERRRMMFGLVCGLVFSFGPFLVWHPQRLLTDIFTYASGAIPYSYPVSGTTFLQYLTIWHIIPSPWTVFPTYIFQLAVAIPATWFLGRWLWAQWGVSRWFVSAASLVMATLLFGRYMNNNYLVMPIMLVIAAYVWPYQTESHD